MKGTVKFNRNATLGQIAALFRAFGGDLHCEFSALSRELTVDTDEYSRSDIESALNSVSDVIESGDILFDDAPIATHLEFDGDRWENLFLTESCAEEPHDDISYTAALYYDVRSWMDRHVACWEEEW